MKGAYQWQMDELGVGDVMVLRRLRFAEDHERTATKPSSLAGATGR